MVAKRRWRSDVFDHCSSRLSFCSHFHATGRDLSGRRGRSCCVHERPKPARGSLARDDDLSGPDRYLHFGYAGRARPLFYSYRFRHSDGHVARLENGAAAIRGRFEVIGNPRRGAARTNWICNLSPFAKPVHR